MKVNIERDGKTIELELKGLKGRDVKAGKEALLDLATVEGEKEQIGKIKDYGNLIEKFASKIAGITIDELDDLDIEDKNKITGYIQNKIDENINFVNSSSLVESSKPKTVQK